MTTKKNRHKPKTAPPVPDSKQCEKTSLIKDRFTWGSIVAAFAIFGGGYYCGDYITRTQMKIEYNDENMNHYKELMQMRDDFDKEKHELLDRIFELQKELLDMKINSNHDEKE